MKKLDTCAALVVMVLSAIVAAYTSELPIWEDTSPGPRFMPLAIAVVGAALSVALLLDVRSRTHDVVVDWPKSVALRQVVLTLAGILGFLVLAPVAGFVPSVTLLTLFILLAALRRKLMPSLLATAITFGLVQGIFVSWLNVPLPKGPLGL